MHDDVIIEVSGRILDDQYVAFGLSGQEGRPEMIGADIVVIGYNKYTNSYIAEDYYMTTYSQCDGKHGVCPDHRIGGKNDAILLNGSRIDSITTGEPFFFYRKEFDSLMIFQVAVNIQMFICFLYGYNLYWILKL